MPLKLVWQHPTIRIYIKYVINNYLDSGVDEIIFKKSHKEFKKIRLLVDNITGEYGFLCEKFNDF